MDGKESGGTIRKYTEVFRLLDESSIARCAKINKNSSQPFKRRQVLLKGQHLPILINVENETTI
jgi:hypothetical protein